MVFDIKIDTERMSLEEIKKARDEVQKVVDTLNHEIRTSRMAKNKFLK